MAKKSSASAVSSTAEKTPNGKLTKAQQVRDYKAAHPRAKHPAIAKALGLNYQTVYAALSKPKKSKKKKAAVKKSIPSVNVASKSAGDIDKAIHAIQLAHELLRVAGSEDRARRAIAAAGKMGLA
ncbi:MAG: hypothetical protein U0795_20030 [Pirellulales bacterium]